MTEPKKQLYLTENFTRAVEYARQLHSEFRKGTAIPYMAHLMGVAAIVMAEAGGAIPVTEDMVIATLLHDTVEDHGGLNRLGQVRAQFGPNVARMVAGLSDTFAEDHSNKEGWEDRKARYIERLRDEGDDVLLISSADKLYNAKSILEDYKEIGEAVWDRFKRGADQQIGYFTQLLELFKQRLNNKIVKEFENIVNELIALTKEPKAEA